MNFESFNSALDTSPALTYNDENDTDNSFLINRIESLDNEYSLKTLIVYYNENKIIQIIKKEIDIYLVIGNKLSSMKKAWEFKQCLAKNIDMKKNMRMNDMMNLWHCISVNDFYYL